MIKRLSAGLPGKLKPAFLSVLFLFSTVGLFGPVMIYLTNPLEFSFVFRDAFHVLLLVLTGGVAAGTLLMLLLPARGGMFERAVALVCALGTALWLQGNVMVWRYGFVDGRDIDWSTKALFGWIDTPVWILVLLSALLYHRPWSRHAVRLCGILLAVQAMATVPHLLKMGEEPGFKIHSASTEGKFRFSSGTNVILLILDNTQSDVFHDVLEADPTVASALEGFTYFRNSVGGYPSTYGAISYILTGRFYENREPFQPFLKEAFLSECSLPRTLLQNGVRVELYPLAEKTLYFSPETMSNLAPPVGVTTRDVAYLYGLTLFRYAPHFLKSRIHHAREWVVRPTTPPAAQPPPAAPAAPAVAENPAPARLPARTPSHPFPEGALQFEDVRFAAHMHQRASVGTDEPLFKFFHRMGSHPPIVLTKDMEYGRRLYNRENYEEFVAAMMRWVGVFLDTLRRIGVYDQSLILILGDHGTSLKEDDLSPRLRGLPGQGNAAAPPHVIASGIPLILVKPIGSTGPLQMLDAPVTLGDVPATVLDALGIPRSCDGIPMFDVPETAPRVRRYLHYQWTHASWKSEYFPVMTEYEVDGFSWDPAAWRATGREWGPRGTPP